MPLRHHQPTLNLGPRALLWPAALSLVVLAIEVAHLLWEHLHGGIQTHHVMRSAQLPGLHNAWGLVLLPALAAWAGACIQRRLASGTRPATVGWAGLIALALGLALSAAFVAGLEDLTANVLMATLLLALVLPGHRAECWLGFVLGTVFTFGAAIPTALGGVIAGLSALLHRGLVPVVRRRWVSWRHG
jgi:hypothetical protein